MERELVRRLESELLAAGLPACPPEPRPGEDFEEMAERWRWHKDAIDAIEGLAKKVKNSLLGIEFTMSAFMEEAGIEGSVTGANTSFKREDFIFARINKGDEEEAHEYIRNVGDESLIKTAVHHSTLNSWVKRRLLSNLPFPDCIKVNEVTKLVTRRQARS